MLTKYHVERTYCRVESSHYHVKRTYCSIEPPFYHVETAYSRVESSLCNAEFSFCHVEQRRDILITDILFGFQHSLRSVEMAKVWSVEMAEEHSIEIKEEYAITSIVPKRGWPHWSSPSSSVWASIVPSTAAATSCAHPGSS